MFCSWFVSTNYFKMTDKEIRMVWYLVCNLINREATMKETYSKLLEMKND
jgi:hypothetical protein